MLIHPRHVAQDPSCDPTQPRYPADTMQRRTGIAGRAEQVGGDPRRGIVTELDCNEDWPPSSTLRGFPQATWLLGVFQKTWG